MTFDEAEIKYRKLQVQFLSGAISSRAEFENRVSVLAVEDDQGVWWQIQPYIAGRAQPAWVFAETLEIVSGDPRTLAVCNLP